MTEEEEKQSEEKFYAFRNGLYSTYFPSEFTTPNQPVVTCDCPFDSNCGRSFKIDIAGMYECEVCKINGFHNEFINKLEGVLFDDVTKHIKSLLNQNDPKHNIPTLPDIRKWHQNLFVNENKNIKKFINKDWGITDSIIQRIQIGVEKNEIVIPIFNWTGQGLAGVNFVSMPKGNDAPKYRMVGGVKLWGYHDLRKSANGANVFITRNISDAITLQMNGYIAVTLLDGIEHWNDEYSKYFKDKSVIICYGGKKVEQNAAIQVILSIIDNASSVKNLNIETGLANSNITTLSEYFNKIGNKFSDFNKVINKLEIIPKSRKNTLHQLQQAAITSNNIVTINPSQDYVEEKLFYAITINDTSSLINSDRETKSIEVIKEDGNIKLTTENIPPSQFSITGITDYTLGTKRANPGAIFQSIREHIKKYVFIKNDDVYTVLALWTMGTYVHRIFDYYPYVHISAEKGSGKSKLMTVLHSIAFNGEYYIEPTESVIFRDVHELSRTLFIDEVEHLQSSNRKSYSSLMSILNSGYSKGGSVPRTKGSRTITYNTFSPKMFAGISNLSDTLSERSIKIRMLKPLHEKLEKYREPIMKQFLEETRDNLYIFGLNYANKVAQKYIDDYDKLPYINLLLNRQEDVWSPILILADIIDESNRDKKHKVLNSAKKYLQEDTILHEVTDSEDNITFKIALIIKEMLQKKTPVKKNGNICRYTTDDLLEYVNQSEEFERKIKKAKLSRMVGKLKIKAETQSVGQKSKKCYDIDTKELEDFGIRYNLWEENPT